MANNLIASSVIVFTAVLTYGAERAAVTKSQLPGWITDRTVVVRATRTDLAQQDGAAVGTTYQSITALHGTQGPRTSLRAALANGALPGTIIEVHDGDGPLVEDLSLADLRGEPQKPIVICGAGRNRAIMRGRLHLTGAAYVVLKSLAFEPVVAGKSAEPCLAIEGEHVQIVDCAITGSPADGIGLMGADNSISSGEVTACEGYGIVLAGSARVSGLQVVSCRRGGVSVVGDALVSNCLILHNRGPALEGSSGSNLRFYHNLVYDNGGGLMLDGCAAARVLNNFFVNNYAATLLSEQGRGDQRRPVGSHRLQRLLPPSRQGQAAPRAALRPGRRPGAACGRQPLRAPPAARRQGRYLAVPKTLGREVRSALAVPRHPPAVHRAEHLHPLLRGSVRRFPAGGFSAAVHQSGGGARD